MTMEYSIIEKKKSRLNIILAEQGILHGYPLYKFFQQNSLFFQDFIEKEFNIAKVDQIILRESDGKQLDINTKLDEYILNDTIIYVFNRMFYRTDLEPYDNEFPLSNTILQKKWSESSYQFSSTSYEEILGIDVSKFLGDEKCKEYENLRLTFADIKNNFTILKDGSQKLKNQKNAGTCAKKNTKNYYNDRKRNFEDKLRDLDSRIASLEPYLNNFHNILDKLKDTPIDDFLKEPSKASLIHYFNIEKIKGLKDNCIRNREKIYIKSNEIKKEILDYDSSLTGLEDNIPSIYEKIKDELQDLENDFHTNIFSIHLQNLRRLIEEKKGKYTKHDIIEFFKTENEHLEIKINKLKDNIENLKQKITDEWIENTRRLKGFIKDIAQIQIIIKDKFTNKLKAFGLLIERYEKEMFAIKLLEKFPETYIKSIIEIKRRNNFKDQYMTLLKMLEKFENTENEARKSFIDIYGEYLPNTFCPFLSRYFPHLNLDLIKNTLDADLTVSIKDTGSLNKSDSGEFIKLINEIYQTIEAKQSELDNMKNLIRERDLCLAQLKTEYLKLKGDYDNLEHKSYKNISKYGTLLEESIKENHELFISNTQNKFKEFDDKLTHFTQAYNKLVKNDLLKPITNSNNILQKLKDKLNEKDMLINELSIKLGEKNMELDQIKNGIDCVNGSSSGTGLSNNKVSFKLNEARNLISLLENLIRLYLPDYTIDKIDQIAEIFQKIIEEKSMLQIKINSLSEHIDVMKFQHSKQIEDLNQMIKLKDSVIKKLNEDINEYEVGKKELNNLIQAIILDKSGNIFIENIKCNDKFKEMEKVLIDLLNENKGRWESIQELNTIKNYSEKEITSLHYTLKNIKEECNKIPDMEAQNQAIIYSLENLGTKIVAVYSLISESALYCNEEPSNILDKIAKYITENNEAYKKNQGLQYLLEFDELKLNDMVICLPSYNGSFFIPNIKNDHQSNKTIYLVAEDKKIYKKNDNKNYLIIGRIKNLYALDISKVDKSWKNLKYQLFGVEIDESQTLYYPIIEQMIKYQHGLLEDDSMSIWVYECLYVGESTKENIYMRKRQECI